MHTVLLVPGPSLRELERTGGAELLLAADLVIGVKRAATRFACHWAVVLDSPDFQKFGDAFIGRPRMLTRAEYRPKYTLLPGLNFEALSDYCPDIAVEWTSVAGLLLAGLLHADRIDVYGADFNGLPEWDGYVSPQADYSPRRWERERTQFQQCESWLRDAKGIDVCRATAARASK
jgi:hypothetical protein